MRKESGNPTLRLALTPMIDVTFLLLIFFMLLPFRSLERKLTAYLPKHKGRSPWRIQDPDPVKVDVILERRGGEEETGVRLLDTYLGRGESAFRLLDDRLAEIHGRGQKWPGFLNAGADVPHRDVIRCVDAFQKAGFETLEFRGARSPPRADR